MTGSPHCSVDAILKMIGDKWTLAILHQLGGGPRRTLELHRAIPGLSTRTLSARLKNLGKEGLLVRQSFRESPPRVEYSLTERGRAITPVLREILKSADLLNERGAELECEACAAMGRVEPLATEPDSTSSLIQDQAPASPGRGNPAVRKRRDVVLL